LNSIRLFRINRPPGGSDTVETQLFNFSNGVFHDQMAEKFFQADRGLFVVILADLTEVAVQVPADNKDAVPRPSKRFLNRLIIRLAINDEGSAAGGFQPVTFARRVQNVIHGGVSLPVVWASVKIVQAHFVFAIDRKAGVVLRTIFNRIAGQVNQDLTALPVYQIDPARGGQNLLTCRQPVAGVDYQIPDNPTLRIDDEIFDMTDVPIRGLNMIALYLLNGSQPGLFRFHRR
jgi:hypothetical protein